MIKRKLTLLNQDSDEEEALSKVRICPNGSLAPKMHLELNCMEDEVVEVKSKILDGLGIGRKN